MLLIKLTDVSLSAFYSEVLVRYNKVQSITYSTYKHYETAVLNVYCNH